MNRFELFTKEILADYAAKRNQPDFPSKLLNPTPANLRDYSLILLAQKLTKDDEKVLMDFFNPMGKYADLEMAIKRFEISKLKPAQNFMLGITKTRDENIIKTVAVLIGFDPRPYALWKQHYDDDNSTNLNNENEEHKGDQSLAGIQTKHDDEEKAEEDHSGFMEEQQKKGLYDTPKVLKDEDTLSAEDESNSIEKNYQYNAPQSIKRNKAGSMHSLRQNQLVQLIGLLILVLILCTSIYLVQEDQCMCWVEDQYVTVSCKEKNLSLKIIALDKEKLHNLKKITRPDTLTINDVSKVWYSKINNEVEFFTGPGMHPVHHHRSLKAATRHIIEVYAGKNAL